MLEPNKFKKKKVAIEKFVASVIEKREERSKKNDS